MNGSLFLDDFLGAKKDRESQSSNEHSRGHVRTSEGTAHENVGFWGKTLAPELRPELCHGLSYFLYNKWGRRTWKCGLLMVPFAPTWLLVPAFLWCLCLKCENGCLCMEPWLVKQHLLPVANWRSLMLNDAIWLGSLWPSRRALQPECEKKVQKSLQNGFPEPPGSGAKKRHKIVKCPLKSLEKVRGESVFDSFDETFSAPRSGRPLEPISRLYSDFFISRPPA